MSASAELLKAMMPQLEVLLPELDEKGRRLVLGAVARAAGDGGTGAVAKATGASWQTVADGAAELGSGEIVPAGRVRRAGGGRKRLADSDPGLLPALLALVEDSTRGDPESPLRWTTKSMAHLAGELAAQGHRCSAPTAWRMLREQGFSMQANAKVLEGRAQHEDRDAQFRYISGQAREHMAAGQPVISIDAKKKEQAGDFAQDGREWHRKGGPVQARDHSFPDPEGGHAIPFGVYDVAANTGFVNVGTGANTASLAVESVRRWWDMTGRHAYPDATRLLVTCDAGGGNGWRNRAWKKGMAQFAQDTGLEVTVCHFPPGTSKWNKIEHRLFSQISHAWRGRPLTSYEVIISTIGAITTSGGLTVTAVLDHGAHPKGQDVSDEEARDIEERCLSRHDFRGEWNYALIPVPRPAREPEPEPPPPGWPRHALNHPALTGMGPADADALAAALEVPAAAGREHDLYARRGHRRRSGGGRRPGFPLADLVLAALILSHLGIQQKELAPAFGMSPDIMSRATLPIRALLATTPHPPLAPPPEHPPATYAELTAYATRLGITGIPDPLPAAGTPPQATLEAPDTPQTHLILKCLRGGVVCAIGTF
jgi:Rhodopirellula transposase DDE domain